MRTNKALYRFLSQRRQRSYFCAARMIFPFKDSLKIVKSPLIYFFLCIILILKPTTVSLCCGLYIIVYLSHNFDYVIFYIISLIFFHLSSVFFACFRHIYSSRVYAVVSEYVRKLHYIFFQTIKVLANRCLKLCGKTF